MAEAPHQGIEEPTSFGQELRREREVRHVSLEEIAAATKISVRFLAALENDDFASLPAPVFTKGFIRAFAIHLGLDPEGMVNSYLYHHQRLRGSRGLDEVSPGSREARALERMRETFRVRRRVVLVLTLAALAIVAAAVWQLTRPASLAPVEPYASSSVPPPATEAPPIPSPPEVASEPSSEPVPQSSSLELRLEFGSQSWLVVVADGKTVASELVDGGSTREFTAEREFRLTLGNAGGVTGWLNGRQLPSFGSSGQVVHGLPIRPTGDAATEGNDG